MMALGFRVEGQHAPHYWHAPRTLSVEKQDVLFSAWAFFSARATVEANNGDGRSARRYARVARQLVHSFGVRYQTAGKFRAPFKAGV